MTGEKMAAAFALFFGAARLRARDLDRMLRSMRKAKVLVDGRMIADGWSGHL